MRLAVLLCAYGGPRSLEEIEPFLRRVIAPREPSPELLERTTARYRAIGGSPLVDNTWAQARALQAALDEDAAALAVVAGEPVETRVFVGMRSSEPFLDEALPAALEWGKGRALAVIMASHQSEVATGGYAARVAALLEGRPESVRFLPEWHLAPGYLDAVAARVESVLALLDKTEREQAPLLFTAHSLAVRPGEEDLGYAVGLKETIGGVLERVGERAWRLGFQSRTSRPGVTWLGPDTDQVLREMAVAGHRTVVVVPLGFVAEHLETLYDLDIDLQGLAVELGVRVVRAATVQDHPAFIAALADVVREALACPSQKGVR